MHASEYLLLHVPIEKGKITMNSAMNSPMICLVHAKKKQKLTRNNREAHDLRYHMINSLEDISCIYPTYPMRYTIYLHILITHQLNYYERFFFPSNYTKCSFMADGNKCSTNRTIIIAGHVHAHLSEL